MRTFRNIPITRRNVSNLILMALGTLWPPNALVVGRNALALRRPKPWDGFVSRQPDAAAAREQLALRALGWICRSQDRVGSGGVGDFRFHGLGPGYPEVTGYIIPTFWDYRHHLGRDELAQRAIRMADWELGVQKPGGGFESLYEGERQPPVVFNTGQVIRGLVRTHEETGEDRYLDAAVRAGDWIVANQEPDGSWAQSNYLGMRRTYDTFVAAALARLAMATSNDAYAKAALANCEFALRNQRPNGWFELCDNTLKGSEAPITHTLCYAADGLIETGDLLGEQPLVAAGERTARAMMDCVEPGGRLPGRFDRNWEPASSYVVVTGSAQLGVLLLKLYARSGDERCRETSLQLLDFLGYIQDLNAVGANRSGGLAGSFPIWGRYVPLKYPSWAAKFFLDQLLLFERVAGVSPGGL